MKNFLLISLVFLTVLILNNGIKFCIIKFLRNIPKYRTLATRIPQSIQLNVAINS